MTPEHDPLREWHRLFGLLLADFFTGSPFEVEVERDLSVQQQLLDVVVVRRRPGPFHGELPDGFAGLTDHNLITFKSQHEALDAWAVAELLGHYVAYRKAVSRSPSDLLPEDRFGLYAVCARRPQGLPTQAPWQERQAGVYDSWWGPYALRVVVAGELPRTPRNAALHLFSASAPVREYGQETYRLRSPVTSGVLGQLFEQQPGRGPFMAYTIHDFLRDYIWKNFPRLTPAERQDLLKALPAEERREMLQALPADERLAGISADERLAGLSADEIRAALERMTAGAQPRPRKPRKKKK